MKEKDSRESLPNEMTNTKAYLYPQEEEKIKKTDIKELKKLGKNLREKEKKD